MGGRTTRLGALALVAGLVVTAVAGCSKEMSAQHEEKMDGIAQRVEGDMLKLPHVTGGRIIYQNNINAPAQAQVHVDVESGASLEEAAEGTMRLLWESSLTPMRTITIYLRSSAQPPQLLEKDYDLSDPAQRSVLEQQWGARPVK